MYQRFLDDAFNPRTPTTPKASLIKRLQQFGGIDVLVKYFQTSQSSSPSNKRQKGHNHLLESILLYLMTLSFFSKLLLFQEEIILQLQVVRECFAIVLLSGIIMMKRRPSGPQRDRGDSIFSKKAVEKTVIRAGQYVILDSNEVVPGDIILIEDSEPLGFDGILIKVIRGCTDDEERQSSILVSQKGQKGQQALSLTVLKSTYDQCCQDMGQSLSLGQDLDPFLYHDASVVEGAGWMLICKIYRRLLKTHESKQLQEGLKGLRQIRKAVISMKILILLPIFIFWNSWLSSFSPDENRDEYQAFIYFIAMMASLLLYLSYLNEDEALEKMSLFYFDCQNGENCTLTNSKALEKFGSIDILIIEEKQYGGKEQFLSMLSQFHDVKIITDKSKNQIEKGFAQELCPYTVYQEDEGLPLRQRVDLLIGCKFISSESKDFNTYYLSLLTQIGYSVLVVSDRLSEYVSFMEYHCVSKKEEWVRTKPGFRILDILTELQVKSSQMAKLKDIYLTVIVNSCLQVLMLIYWACRGTIVGLNFNLVVLYVNRNAASDLIEIWSQQSIGWGLKQMSWIYYNVYLLAYYLFIMREIEASDQKPYLLFLLMVANRLFRTDALKPELSVSRVAIKVGLLLLVLACEVGVTYYTTAELRVKEEWVGIVALPAIVAVFRRYGRGVQ